MSLFTSKIRTSVQCIIPHYDNTMKAKDRMLEDNDREEDPGRELLKTREGASQWKSQGKSFGPERRAQARSKEPCHF